MHINFDDINYSQFEWFLTCGLMNYEFKKPSELDIPLDMNRNQSMKHKPAVMYLNEALKKNYSDWDK